MNGSRWLFVACAAALLGACSVTTSDNPFAGGGEGSDRAIRLQVENQQFNEARLTAIRTGGRTRIGRVGGNQIETFTIDWPGDSRLEVEIDLLAGGTYRTRPVSVNPGDMVELIITQPLHRSYLRR